MMHPHRLLSSAAIVLASAATQAQDPYVHLERMQAKIKDGTTMHVRVVVTGSDGQGHRCASEVYECYRTPDEVLNIRPGAQMLATTKAFVLVDTEARTIELQERDRSTERPGIAADDPLQGLEEMRKEWRKASVVAQNDSTIKYRYVPPDGPFREVQVEVDKQRSTLRHIRYVLRQDPGDGCTAMDLDYQVMDLSGKFPRSVFAIDRFLEHGKDGSWRPAKAFKGYTVHRPTGS